MAGLFRSDRIGTGPWILISTRFLYANRNPLRSKTPCQPCATARQRSHREDGRSRGLARGEIGMRLCGVLQWIGLVHLDLDRAGLDDVEQLARHRDQALTLGGVGEQRRPGDVERALLR